MLKHIIKFIVFLAVGTLFYFLWADLLTSWKSNIHVPNVGRLPVQYETNTRHKEDLSGFRTQIYLSELDVENLQDTFLVSVDYDRKTDTNGKFPSALRSVDLKIYQPANASPITLETTIPISNYVELSTSAANEISVLSNYLINVPLYPQGWYPYEIYHIEIEPQFVFRYRFSRGPGTRIILDIPSALFNNLTQYDVTLCNPGNPDPIFKDCQNLPAEIHKIVVQQPGEKKDLFFIIAFLFVVFTLATFWIYELSSLLEVAVGLLLGIWGLRAVLIPDKVPYSLSWGGEHIIVNFYISLGLVIIFWIINSVANPLLRMLINPPTISGDLLAPFWARFPRLMSFLFEVDEYWDTNTVAEFLGIPPNEVREEARNNNLPGEKINNRWRFQAQEIIRISSRYRDR